MLLEAMTERAHWVYALPPASVPQVELALAEGGFALVEQASEGGVRRFQDASAEASFVLYPSDVLEVLLVDVAGVKAVEVLAKILDSSGFYAQSQLLGTALDVRDPEAPKALRTLAHMVVAWDEDWTDAFLLHLAAPDPVIRHEAVASLSVAALVARDAAPATALLHEAARRERFPKLKETMLEAVGVLEAALGKPVEIAADPAES